MNHRGWKGKSERDLIPNLDKHFSGAGNSCLAGPDLPGVPDLENLRERVGVGVVNLPKVRIERGNWTHHRGLLGAGNSEGGCILFFKLVGIDQIQRVFRTFNSVAQRKGSKRIEQPHQIEVWHEPCCVLPEGGLMFAAVETSLTGRGE
jgi:hypothetical protein